MTETPLFLLLLSIPLTGAGIVLGQRFLAGRAVERAVWPEVVALRWQAAAMAAEIARRHEDGEAFDAAFFSAWRLSEPQTFPALGSGLGLLPPLAVDRVGYFHMQLAAARGRLAEAAAQGGFRPSPYRVMSCLLRACNHVEPWIRAVRPRADAGLGDIPDLPRAHRLLETLERAGGEPFAIAYCWADACARWEGAEEDADETAGAGGD